MPHLSEQPEQNHAMQATAQLLRSHIPMCAGCGQSLDGHTYRFFSCHPDVPTKAGASFAAAIAQADWATVHAMQTPSIGQPGFVVYAITCPSHTGGMVAVLQHKEAETGDAQLYRLEALSAEAYAALRALCSTCQWVAFN
jgi:hypothetical protein